MVPRTGSTCRYRRRYNCPRDKIGIADLRFEFILRLLEKRSGTVLRAVIPNGSYCFLWRFIGTGDGILVGNGGRYDGVINEKRCVEGGKIKRGETS
jgi:hypothetical protein